MLSFASLVSFQMLFHYPGGKRDTCHDFAKLQQFKPSWAIYYCLLLQIISLFTKRSCPAVVTKKLFKNPTI